jgi:PAS domain S-box-containing protein
MLRSLDNEGDDAQMGNSAAPQTAGKRISSRPGPLAYVVAVLAPAASTVVQLLLDPLIGDALIFSTYFAAVVIAAAYGGLWPGILAILLCCLCADWFFIEPLYSFVIPSSATGVWIGLMTFSLISLAVAGFSEAMHRSRRAAQYLAEQRAAALEAAAAGREWLSVTLSSIGDAVIATDAVGRVSFLNQTAEQLIGWTNEEATGRLLKDVFHIINERTRQAVEDPCERVLNTGRVVGLANHTVLISRDGTEKPIDDSAAPIRDEKGNIRGVVLVFRDATQQRRAQETNENLAAIVEHSDEAIIGKRLDGILTSWNKAAERLYGYTAAEAVGQPITLIVPDDRRAELATIMERLRRGVPIDHLETVRVRKDGRRVDVSLTISPIKNNDGEVIGASKIARDITEQKRTREALQRREEHAQLLSEASKSVAAVVDVKSSMDRLARLCVPRFADWCVFYLADEQGEIRPIARAHRDSEAEPLLAELSTHYPPHRRAASMSHRVLRSGIAEYSTDLQGTTFDAAAGDSRHDELHQALAPRSQVVVPLASRGRTIGVIEFDRGEARTGFTADEFEIAQELARRAATAIENSRLYDELRRADRQKDDFLAMLAHELRNPLAAIDYATQLASISPEQAAAAGEIIQRQVRQLARLIDDLLDVSRITRDKIELRKEPVDAAQLVNRAAGTVAPIIDKHHHQLTVDVSSDEMPLFADPTRTEQIIVNLLTNAAKYTPEGGQITLRAFPQNDQIVITVKDTGIGIPSEMLPRVFELFTQVNPKLDRAKGGLGIGLTVVRRLTEMHGGSVSATSEGLGKGSEFTVRLPRGNQRGQDDLDAAPRSRPRHGLRVLVVEDNVDTATSVSQLLQKAGCATNTVHDGMAALERAAAFRPEAVLLDIGLPGIDGYEVARRLRADPRHGDLRLIAISGYGQAQDQERSKEAGFNDHLVKPIDFDSLLSKLAEA